MSPRPTNASRGLPPARSQAARARPAKQVTLPRELWATLDQRAEDLATTRTAVIEAAVRAFLGTAE